MAAILYSPGGQGSTTLKMGQESEERKGNLPLHPCSSPPSLSLGCVTHLRSFVINLPTFFFGWYKCEVFFRCF